MNSNFKVPMFKTLQNKIIYLEKKTLRILLKSTTESVKETT